VSWGRRGHKEVDGGRGWDCDGVFWRVLVCPLVCIL